MDLINAKENIVVYNILVVLRPARQHNISHSTIWRILKMQQLYPYHVQKVQSSDLPRR
jgi:hypothetical protein